PLPLSALSQIRIAPPPPQLPTLFPYTKLFRSSFLGLGAADDSVPEWGQMLGGAQNIIDSHPHLAFWPAGCIIVVAPPSICPHSGDRKSTRLNSNHVKTSYAVFSLKKKNRKQKH